VGPGAVSKLVTVLSKLVTDLRSAEARIGPLRFQARCRRRRVNLAFVFCVYFVL